MLARGTSRLTRLFTTAHPAMSSSKTPVEDSIRAKITSSLFPTALAIHNDSSKHAHHAAMRTNYASDAPNLETHFRVHIVSAAFEGKMLMARHRMVNKLLKEELEREGGVHALQMVTRTEAEEERIQVKEVELHKDEA